MVSFTLAFLVFTSVSFTSFNLFLFFKMILLIFGISTLVLILAMLLAFFLSWAYQKFEQSNSDPSDGESSETVPRMELEQMPQWSPPPSYSSNSGVPIIHSRVVIGKLFDCRIHSLDCSSLFFNR